MKSCWQAGSRAGYAWCGVRLTPHLGCCHPQEPFTITPRFTNDAATFRFELDVVVDQALLIDKTFPDFLPAQVRAGGGAVRVAAVGAKTSGGTTLREVDHMPKPNGRSREERDYVRRVLEQAMVLRGYAP